MTPREFIDSLPETDECIIWPYAKVSGRYGVVYYGGKQILTHRYVLEKKLGRPLGKRMCACHTCDTPACVNPRHLFEGTQQDNNRDKVEKQRQARGSRAGMSKLTDSDVHEIRRLLQEGLSQTKVGERFGITQSSVEQIAHGKSWGWLETPGIEKYVGGFRRGERHKDAKLTADDVREIRRRIEIGHTQASIAADYGLHHSSVWSIAKGKKWGWLDRPAM